ncbi:MAG: hypothetical protein WCF06_08565 [Nitrososphaeraceae archaeon]
MADPSVASGVYRSIDSAENWTRMEDGLPPISTFGATGIVIDNSDPDITYTAFCGYSIYESIYERSQLILYATFQKVHNRNTCMQL